MHATATLLLLDGLQQDFRSAVDEAQRLALGVAADPEAPTA